MKLTWCLIVSEEGEMVKEFITESDKTEFHYFLEISHFE